MSKILGPCFFLFARKVQGVAAQGQSFAEVVRVEDREPAATNPSWKTGLLAHPYQPQQTVDQRELGEPREQTSVFGDAGLSRNHGRKLTCTTIALNTGSVSCNTVDSLDRSKRDLLRTSTLL